MNKSHEYISLNKSDLLYLAFEDLVPSAAQIITLRFKTKHGTEEIKSAFLHMLSLYPKLRAIIEPTLLSYRFKILNDEHHIKSLFDNAFSVETGLTFDSKEYKILQNNLLKESFTLQHSLPFRIKYLPEENIIFITLHHITSDGAGWLHMTSSLLAYLNEKETTPVPVDNPSMTPGIFKSPYITIPRQLYDSWLIHKEDKKITSNDKVIIPSPKRFDFFGYADMQQKFLKYNLSELKPRTKELGCSLNVYILTAIARTFFNLYDEDKGDTVAIRLSYDLRPYFEKDKPVFGNYVTTTVLRAYRQDINQPELMISKFQDQLSEAINRLKNKQLSYPWFIDKVFTLLGKKIYSQGILLAKKKSIFQSTIHFSTLGNGDWLNNFGEKSKVKDLIFTVPTSGLFITMLNIDGIFNINLSYPSEEFSHDTITSITNSFDNELGFLLKDKNPAPAINDSKKEEQLEKLEPIAES